MANTNKVTFTQSVEEDAVSMFNTKLVQLNVYADKKKKKPPHKGELLAYILRKAIPGITAEEYFK